MSFERAVAAEHLVELPHLGEVGAALQSDTPIVKPPPWSFSLKRALLPSLHSTLPEPVTFL